MSGNKINIQKLFTYLPSRLCVHYLNPIVHDKNHVILKRLMPVTRSGNLQTLLEIIPAKYIVMGFICVCHVRKKIMGVRRYYSVTILYYIVIIYYNHTLLRHIIVVPQYYRNKYTPEHGGKRKCFFFQRMRYG